MLNALCLVGRIEKIEENSITMTIPRPFKNENGEFESDSIEVKLLSNSILNKAKEYCEVGNLIGIKGRLQKTNDIPYAYPVADKITVLSKPKDIYEGEEENDN